MQSPHPPLSRLRSPPRPPFPERAPPVESGNVLIRLHALFTPHSPVDASHGDETGAMYRSKTSPARPLSPPVSPGTFVDRDAIKVLVVTWNMGDALPKGDLTVLLGDVPAYTPPTATGTTVPQLPIENKHPYHIVVIAGQECPTDSGVPRGLGGGIMKGVHVRTGHRREKEERRKEKGKEKDEESEGNAPDSARGDGLKNPSVETDEDAEDDPMGHGPTPSANAPVPHKHYHPPGSRGWSTMLDDWFCGTPTLADKSVVPSQIPSPGNSPKPLDYAPSVSTVPASSLGPPMPPGLLRSSSAPVGIPQSPTEPLQIPQRAPPFHAFAHSPLARSASSSSSSSSSDEGRSAAIDIRVKQDVLPNVPAPKSSSLPLPKEKPAIVIPNDEPARTREGGKCYLHLVKERLMGMYLSVYVYKGCEHLVQGVDKDFVTAGLAGGRLGNKGGIGISLKLADHRFLFINSHLAAHSTRVSARLANIAKIKSELRLDTFLPKDDPRNALEDLTDRFDTVFWCGDLNFRLELSRLHAEWLVEQKKYSEALMWDQLKAVMKDPEKNPFPGFHEHTIDFPPTFKYDVWRSIKATNRELKRSLRRRATLEGKTARRPSNAEVHPGAINNPALSHVPEADATEEEGGGTPERLEDGGGQKDDDARSFVSRQSFESTTPSTAGGYTSGGRSTAGTDAEDEEFSTSIDASAYGSRHRALEAAIKAKTKNWLSLVKMDKVLSPSGSGRRILGRSASKKWKEVPNREGLEQRRTSISSIGSLEPPNPIGDLHVAGASNHSVYSSEPPLSAVSGGPRRPSDASFLSASPSKPIGRRLTLLKRTVSGRSIPYDEAQDVYAEDIDESIDNREGVYDTSKKQRVPSWCDRVLWKSRITPDIDEPIPSNGLEDEHHDRGSRALHRISHAFTHFGDHLRLSMTRTGSAEAKDRANVHLSPLLPLDTEAGSERTIVASPEASPAEMVHSAAPRTTTPEPIAHRAAHSSPVIERLTGRARSGSATHPLLHATAVQTSPAYPKITFDPALPADADRIGSARPRANSDSGHDGGSVGMMKRSISSTSNGGLVTHPRGRERRSSGEVELKSVQSEDPSQSPHPLSAPSHLSTGDTPHASHPEDRNAFVKFIRDLPTLLHVRSAPHSEPVALPVTHNGLMGPKRHLKGEVECLHYGTIDDAGMRLLEGRSDHRPAIFAAAVYVGE